MISRLIGHIAPPAGFCWRPPHQHAAVFTVIWSW
jgi:hypothetical protein